MWFETEARLRQRAAEAETRSRQAKRCLEAASRQGSASKTIHLCIFVTYSQRYMKYCNICIYADIIIFIINTVPLTEKT